MILTLENIANRIVFVRGQKVMLDVDLAGLYQVKTKELNKAVKRNRIRFPADFTFQLTLSELKSLRFQIGTSNGGRGGRRYRPFVFTEHGIAMLSSVLKSERAAKVNVAIMRAFIQLREMAATTEEFARKLYALEVGLQRHDRRLRNHGREIRIVFQVIRSIMTPRQIGFKS